MAVVTGLLPFSTEGEAMVTEDSPFTAVSFNTAPSSPLLLLEAGVSFIMVVVSVVSVVLL